MKKLMNKKDGFTLIELMIVVVIIGILAAVAIPQFLKYQLKSKTTEASRSLGAIKTNQEAFSARWNSFAAAANTPDSAPIANTRPWEVVSNEGFDLIGFTPAGQVYYSYGVEVWAVPDITGDCEYASTVNSTLVMTGTNVTVGAGLSRNAGILMYAAGDLDEDGEWGCFVMSNSQSNIIPVPGGAGETVF